MNRKIIFIISIIFSLHLQAVKPKIVTIINGENQYNVPTEIIDQTGLKELVHENILNITKAQLPGPQVQQISDIMHSAYKYKNLKGKALLSEVSDSTHFANKIDLINFLKTADYFNYPLALQLAAREIIKSPEAIKAVIDLKNQKEIVEGKEYIRMEVSQDAFDAIGRMYYLKNNKQVLPGISKDALRFSVRDYLDYMPQIIALKPYQYQEEAEGAMQGYSLDLSKLYLNNLEGLQEINNIHTVTELILNENLLEEIKDDSFEGANRIIQLSLNKNRIKKISAHAFDHLINLDSVGLSDNFLTDLPANLFKNNNQLGAVYLYNNQLTHLDRNFFKGKYKLLIANLGKNKLKTLDPNMFNGITKVRVSLHGNPLTDQTKKILNVWNEKHSYTKQLAQLPSGRSIEDKLPVIEF